MVIEGSLQLARPMVRPPAQRVAASSCLPCLPLQLHATTDPKDLRGKEYSRSATPCHPASHASFHACFSAHQPYKMPSISALNMAVATPTWAVFAFSPGETPPL